MKTWFINLCMILGVLLPQTAFSQDAEPAKLQQFGELKSIATNSLNQATTLKELGLKKGFYGIGMSAGLHEELLIVDGQVLSSGFQGWKYEQEAHGESQSVGFLAYTEKPQWRPLEDGPPIETFQDLEHRLGESSRNDVPLAVLVRARCDGLRWFIVGGMGNLKPTPTESFLRSRVLGGLNDVDITAFGFYSTRHEGRITSPGQKLHLHFRVGDGSFVGHLDSHAVFTKGGPFKVFIAPLSEPESAVQLQTRFSQNTIKPYVSKESKSMSKDRKAVLFVLTSHAKMGDLDRKTGYYVPEAAHPWKVIRDAGFEVEFASVQGGRPPADGLKLEDPIVREFWENPQVQSDLSNTKPLSEVVVEKYAAIFVVGGHGTMWDLPNNTTLQNLLADQYQSGGIVAAVCHGPAALVNVKLPDGKFLVDGKAMAAFTDEEEKAVGLDTTVPFLLSQTLASRGARMQPAANFQESVVTDDRLITGQNPASATGVANAIVNAMKQNEGK